MDKWGFLLLPPHLGDLVSLLDHYNLNPLPTMGNNKHYWASWGPWSRYFYDNLMGFA
jgi:hypothetical protein